MHNFIVTHELESVKSKNNRNHLEFDDEVLAFISANPSEIVGIFGDETNDENQGRGRSENIENRILKRQGKEVRSNIRRKFSAA